MNQKLILQAPLLNILLVPLGSDGGVVGSCLDTSAMVVIRQNRENRQKRLVRTIIRDKYFLVLGLLEALETF